VARCLIEEEKIKIGTDPPDSRYNIPREEIGQKYKLPCVSFNSDIGSVINIIFKGILIAAGKMAKKNLFFFHDQSLEGVW
jgi:hypothetical protein